MPPRPVPRPHFTSLGFTWLPLCASHRLALRLLVLPPSRRALPPSSHTRPPFAPSSPSSHTRARASERSLSPCPAASLPFFIGGSSCAPRPHPLFSPGRRSHPAPLLPVPPLVRPHQHSHRPFVHKSTEKRFFVSSRLVSSPSARFAPFSPFPRLLLLPLPSFFLLALLPPPLLSSFPTGSLALTVHPLLLPVRAHGAV